jgi:hypothetical protein
VAAFRWACRSADNRSTAEIGRISARHTLRPGDVLYVPRGQLHEAFTGNEASIHITVGLLGLSWTDVLREALQQLIQQDVTLRRSLPPGCAEADTMSAEVRRTLTQMRRKIATELPLEAALTQITDRFISRRPQNPAGRFTDLAATKKLTAETTLMRRPDVLFRTWPRKQAVHLLFHRKKVSFPSFVAPSLRHLARSSGPFQPKDLPGSLTLDSKVLLCRMLVREGFLQIANQRAGV